jgi:flagellar export protein FliJ
MKSRESVVRLKRFQVDEKRRQVEQIDMMIAEFERMSGELDAQIDAEKERTGISDPGHFAYSTFARAADQRRQNLRASVAELRAQREVEAHMLSVAEEELSKTELLAERDQGGKDRADLVEKSGQVA